MSRPPVSAAAGEQAPDTAQPPAKAAGVGSLIRGNRAHGASERVVTNRTQVGIPRWYLFGGDLLLVALALITAYKSPRPLTWQEMLFCAVVVALGACLAIIAVSAGEPPPESPRMKTGPFANGRPR